MKTIILSTLFLFPLVSEMTVEEEVGQILMFPIHGEDFNQQMAEIITEINPGGIILYDWSNNLTSPKRVNSLTDNLQKHSKTTLFIGIDEEGGRIDRLNLGAPSAKEIGKTLDPDLAMKAGANIGAYLKKVGINLNFAPVVDINSNPENQVIADRSFGENPFVVTEFAKKFALGLISFKVMPCLKHFPGHGDVSSDSHYTLPISLKTLEDLMENELIPYKKLIPLTPFIMTAHILFPNIDKDNPATLSKIFVSDILRNKLGYQGLIITDSLRMGALKEPLTETAIKAFNAGNDILLIGGNALTENDPDYNIKQISLLHKNLVEAVKDGRISKERLEESLRRIKKYKNYL
jgi:beta-N-acetylhexosaminidase